MVEAAHETTAKLGRRMAADIEAMLTRMLDERAAALHPAQPASPLTGTERIAAAADFGRQQAAKIEAVMDGISADATRLGFDGKTALQAAFTARTEPAARSFDEAPGVPSPPRPRLVWSRD